MNAPTATTFMHRIAACAAVFGAATGASAQVQCVQQLIPSGTSGLEGFGSQVSYSQGRALLGAPDAGANGAAALFEHVNGSWVETVRFVTPTSTALDDGFGYDVAVAPDIAVVGAPFEPGPWGSDQGAAYVYRRDPLTGAWTYVQRLSSSGIVSGDDGFGIAVAMSGQYLLIGAVGDDTAALNCGAAYAYRLVGGTWILEAKLLPTAVQPGMRFGLGVALQGSQALVGAPFEDYGGGNDVGAAYFFERQPNTTWPFAQRLESPVISNSTFYAIGVAISGNRMVIGAEGANNGAGANSGLAYTYVRAAGGAWFPSGTLVPSTPAAGETFGQQVEVFGDFALVNARGDTTLGAAAGSVHLFRSVGANAWAETRVLFSPSASPAAFESFGTGIALIQGVALVGSPGTDLAGINSGAATLFDVGAADCNGNGNPDSCDIATGLALDCNGNGVPDSCDVASGASPDCNGNGVPDSCEVQSGAAPDCNGNGVPDSCDIGTVSTDCDLDGQPDECQIAANPALDCNGDGTLDVCQLGQLDCNGNGLIDSCEIAAGLTPDLNQNLRPDTCEVLGTIYCAPNAPNSAFQGGAHIDAFGTGVAGATDVMLRAQQLPMNSFGFFLNSQASGFTPFPPNSVGILCLSGAIGRFQQQIVNSGAAGVFYIPIDLNAIPRPTGPATVLPGQTWYFQGWYRDSIGGQSTSNFTTAVEIQFQ